MRKMPILLALAVLTASNLGCTRCRNLFRRGSPCGGTALAAPAMLGGAIPLGNPVNLQPAPQILQPNVMAAPQCCPQAAPICVPCDPCPTNCVPCETGCVNGETGYINAAADCGCAPGSGEYFGGYVEGSEGVPTYEGNVVPGGTTTDPYPTN